MHVVITFVRHGETDWNRMGKLQGTSDTELNNEGIMQANQVAERLVKETTQTSSKRPVQDGQNPQPVELIISSQKLRALETAKTIKKELEKVYKCEIPLIETELAQERCLGEYEGKKYSDFVQDLKKYADLNWDSLPHSRIVYATNILAEKRPEFNIETEEEFHRRVNQLKQFICLQCIQHMKNHPNKDSKRPFHVVVVSHGMFLRGLLGAFIYENQNKTLACHLYNTSVSRVIAEIRIDEKNVKNSKFIHPCVVVLNDCSHNNKEERTD